MIEYEAQDVYVVNPLARLRNDGKYVIAGFPEQVSTSVVRLAPIEGVTVSLFNGLRTCAEIEDICTALADNGSEDPKGDARSAVKTILNRHSEPLWGAPEPLLIPKSSLTAEKCRNIPDYRPTDFIVSKEAYTPEDLKLSFPASLFFLLTNDCQVSCQYCYMHKPRIAKKYLLPWERAKELIHEGYDKGAMAIYISGGDVLCYPHLFDFLDELEDLNFPPIDIATKAYISPESAARLTEYKAVGNIQFSIDSTLPTIADFLTQSPGFCDRIMRSIKNIREAGDTSISIKAVITPYNLPTIPKLYRDFKNMGIKQILLASYAKSGYHHKDKLFNHPDDYKWLDSELEKLRQEFSDDGISYQNGAPQLVPESGEEKQKKWESRARCTAGRDNLTICSTGKVIACEQMPEWEEGCMGDLKVQSIEEVWKGEAMDQYLVHPPRERFKGSVCYECEEFDECQTYMGACVRDSIIHYGSRWCPPPNCPRAPEPRPREV